MSQAHELKIRGPEWGRDPLWSGVFVVADRGRDAHSDAVLESPAIRLLLQDVGAGETVALRTNGPDLEFKLISPRLLASAAALNPSSSRAKLEIIGQRVTLAPAPSADQARPFNEIRLTPDEPWPKADRLYEQTNGAWTLATPRLRLAFGALRGELKSAAHLGLKTQNGRAVLLGLDAPLVDGRLLIDLEPEGVAFTLQAPDPFDGAPFEAKVLLAAEDDGGLTLRLVGCEAAKQAALYEALGQLERGLQQSASPLQLSLERTGVPPLRWPLEKVNGVWTVSPNATLLRGLGVAASVSSEPLMGGEPARADLARESIRIERKSGGFAVQVATAATATADDGVQGPDVTHEWTAARPATTAEPQIARTATLKVTGAVHVLIDTDRVEDQLVKAWRASGALRADQTHANYLFVPLDRGWLQVATPGEATARAPVGLRDRPAFNGAIRLSFTPTAEAASRNGLSAVSGEALAAQPAIEILSAGQIISWSDWRLGGDAPRLVKVTTQINDARGALRGLLWAAQTSPTPQEILPSLLNGPAALTELPIAFGSDAGHGLKAKLQVTAQAVDLQLTGWSAAPAALIKAVAWCPHPQLPLVSAVTMTRTAAVATGPSPLRDLTPSNLALDGGGVRLSLPLQAQRDLPSLALSNSAFVSGDAARLGWPWPTDKRLTGFVPMVSPTMPGLEFAPRALFGAPFETTAVSLRADLPILDELFSSLTLPSAPKKPGVKTAYESPPTALDLDALTEFWAASAERLSLALTDGDRLTYQTAQGKDTKLADLYPADLGGTAKVFIRGLIEPATWATDFKVGIGSGDASAEEADLPLGHYVLGKGAAVRGETMLAGYSGGFTKTGDTLSPAPVGGADITVTGFTAASQASGGFLIDNRGLGLAALPAAIALSVSGSLLAPDAGVSSASVRDSQLADVAGKSLKRRHITAGEPIALELCGRSVSFWFRDLPLCRDGAIWTFTEPKGPDRTVGNDPQLWSRERLSASLYEWRLYEAARADKPQWAVALGPFDFLPLRLHSCAFEENQIGLALKTVTLIGSVGLPNSAQDNVGPFGPEALYASGNLVALNFVAQGGRLKLLTLSRVSIAGQNLEVAAGSPNLDLLVECATDAGGADHPARLIFTLGLKDGALIGELASARLETRVLGVDRTLTQGEVTLGSGQVDVKFSAVPAASGGLSFESVRLSVLPTPILTIKANIIIAPVGASVCAMSYGLGQDLGWLGASFSLLKMPSVTIDHQQGLVRLEGPLKAKDASQAFFQGFDLGADGAGAVRAVLAFGAADADGVTRLLTGHVEFLWQGGGWRVDHLLQHDPAKGWLSKMLIDGRWGGADFIASTIGWPVEQLPRDLPLTGFAGGNGPWAADIDLGSAGQPLCHRVAPLIRRQPFDVALLRDNGASATLTLRAPWRFRAIVHHQLSQGPTLRTWTTLDEVMLFDVQALHKEAREDLSINRPAPNRPFDPAGPYAFQARYQDAKVDPDILQDDHRREREVLVTGVVRRALAQAGFPVRKINRLLSSRSAALVGKGLALTGSSVGDFWLSEEAAVTATMPWIAPWGGHPDAYSDIAPLDKIVQFDDKPRTFRASAYDIEAGHARNLKGPTPARLALGDGSAKSISHGLESLFGAGKSPPPMEPVDQSTTYEKIARGAVAAAPGREPIWFRSLMALHAIWRTPQDQALMVSTVLTDAEGLAARLTLPSTAGDSTAPQAEDGHDALPAVTLLIVARERVFIDILPPAMAKGLLVGGELQTDLSARAALLARAYQRTPRPLAVELAIVDARASGADHLVHGRWRRLDLPSALPRVASVRLRDRRSTLYQSQTLGWPTAPDAQLSRLGLGLGPEQPLRDEGLAWAGRARVLKAPATALPITTDVSALFVASGRRTLFRRPSLPDLMTPPDRAGMPVSPRPRTPIPSVLREALKKQAGPNAAALGAILPPELSIAATGLRPGVLGFEHDGVIAPEPLPAFDDEFDRFGAPASRAPLVWRQVRAPRSGALPPNSVSASNTLLFGRRTYVHQSLRGDDGQLKAFLLYKGSAALVRGMVAGQDTCVTVRPASISQGGVGPGFTGQITVCASDLTAARGLGLWPAAPLKAVVTLPEAGLEASLTIGGQQFAFETVAEHDEALTFSMRAETFRQALAWLAQAPADHGVVFGLRGRSERQSGQIKEDLASGPPNVARLPLSRIPFAASWQSVEFATLVFGDPAYDRELNSLANSDLNDQTRFMLSLDRAEYDAAATVYFAAGVVKAETGAFDPIGEPIALTLTLERSLPDGAPLPPQSLTVNGLSTLQLCSAKAYGLPLSSLRAGPEGLDLQPGDGLVFECSSSRRLDVTRVRIEILAAPAFPPPSAVYSLVTHPRKQVLEVALHAVSPMPDTVEFPSLLADLASGLVRRRALFTWRYTSGRVLGDAYQASLVKMDRTGGGQLPNDLGSFQRLEP